MMKSVLGLVLAGCLIAACGGGTKSSTTSTTTAAGQKANHPNKAENQGTAPASQESPGGIETTPFNK
jgi:ABC-type glycerol-3-phosphate transport system substrate-binding protein